MFRLVFVSGLKGSAALLAILSFGSIMGLPVNDPWFDVLLGYIVVKWTLASIVNGMPEPELSSSVWYVWCYRSLHSMAHQSTAYFTHKRIWKYLTGEDSTEDK